MKTAIVILNWNGWKDTIECLESLDALTPKDFFVIVVDNASSNESREKLIEWGENNQALKFRGVIDEENIESSSLNINCSHWVYLQSSINGGFAAGNNLGIRFGLQAGCEFVWLLNNDTTVTSNALNALVSHVSRNPKIGMCGSIICYYDDPITVQAVGGVHFNVLKGVGEQIGQGLKYIDPKIEELVKLTPTYIAGASLFLSKKLLLDVGQMEEGYFLYFEEMDWAMRARGKFEIATAAGSVIYHKEGASIGTASRKKRSPLSQYYLNRNLIRFYVLRKPWLLPVALLSVMQELLKLLIKQDWVLAKVTFEAFIDGVLMRSGSKTI